MSTQQHTYSELPERVEHGIPAHTARFPTAGAIAESWPETEPAQPNADGDTEEPRGQQHLWHLNPKLHPQEAIFLSPEAPGLLGNPRPGSSSPPPTAGCQRDQSYRRICSGPSRSSAIPGSRARCRGISTRRHFVRRIDRRERLIDAWRSPVLVLQGADDPMQPREYYVDEDVSRRLPAGSEVELLDAGHFWPFEAPEESAQAIENFLLNSAR
jgi:pimeloyl-ACP methyl ester carboxylesterase